MVLIVGGGGASSKKEMGLISGLSVPAQSLVQAGKMTRAFLWGQARVPDWCRKTVHHSSGGSIVSCSCLIQTGATTLAVCLCRPAGFPWGLFGQRAHPRSLGDWVGRSEPRDSHQALPTLIQQIRTKGGRCFLAVSKKVRVWLI